MGFQNKPLLTHKVRSLKMGAQAREPQKKPLKFVTNFARSSRRATFNLNENGKFQLPSSCMQKSKEGSREPLSHSRSLERDSLLLLPFPFFPLPSRLGKGGEKWLRIFPAFFILFCFFITHSDHLAACFARF